MIIIIITIVIIIIIIIIIIITIFIIVIIIIIIIIIIITIVIVIIIIIIIVIINIIIIFIIIICIKTKLKHILPSFTLRLIWRMRTFTPFVVKANSARHRKNQWRNSWSWRVFAVNGIIQLTSTFLCCTSACRTTRPATDS